jgi:hypothetical protein
MTKQTDEDTKPLPPDDDEPAKISFSVPQIVGGALAAVTVAVVGSTLGTAGTVIGAALASVVGAVAGTLYTAGIDRGRRSVGSAISKGWQRVRGHDPAVDLEASDDLTLVLEPVEAQDRSEPEQTVRNRSRTWRRVLLRASVSALAIFAIAFAAITAWELSTGQTLSGDTGTTITGGGNRRPSRTPSPSPTVTVTTTPTASPSVSPSVTPTATPTPTATATVTLEQTTPTVAPTQVASTSTAAPSATVSAEPTP